jgi:hypothetical protein
VHLGLRLMASPQLNYNQACRDTERIPEGFADDTAPSADLKSASRDGHVQHNVKI